MKRISDEMYGLLNACVSPDDTTLNEWADETAQLEVENASLTEEMEQMKPYVRHKPTCSIYIKWSLGCDCGFNALLGE